MPRIGPEMGLRAPYRRQTPQTPTAPEKRLSEPRRRFYLIRIANRQTRKKPEVLAHLGLMKTALEAR